MITTFNCNCPSDTKLRALMMSTRGVILLVRCDDLPVVSADYDEGQLHIPVSRERRAAQRHVEPRG